MGAGGGHPGGHGRSRIGTLEACPGCDVFRTSRLEGGGRGDILDCVRPVAPVPLRPVVGAPHKFSAPIGFGVGAPLPEELDAPVELPARAVALWSPPRSCPEHPGSHVVRNGTYGLKTPKRRQRYRCYYDPNDKTRRHSFTPLLPRDHVCEGEEHCAHFEELRGVHRGETAVARRHSWPTRVVVRGLEQLAAGGSYADVGRLARRVTDTMRTRTRPDDGDRAADTGRTSDTHDDAEDDAEAGWHAGCVESSAEDRAPSTGLAAEKAYQQARSRGPTSSGG